MKGALEIIQLYAATLLGLVAVLLLAGCASKGRTSSYTTTVVRDGLTGEVIEETKAETHKHHLRASGYKLALEKIHAEERRGDYHYSIGADSAEATPESQALKAFQLGLGTAAQFYGITPQLSPSDLADVRALLTELREVRASLENR